MGQVYMLVGGAPEKSATHVRDVALVSLDLRDELESTSSATGLKEHVRIGKRKPSVFHDRSFS